MLPDTMSGELQSRKWSHACRRQSEIDARKNPAISHHRIFFSVIVPCDLRYTNCPLTRLKHLRQRLWISKPVFVAGLDLPDAVLGNLYHDNAVRFFGIGPFV